MSKLPSCHKLPKANFFFTEPPKKKKKPNTTILAGLEAAVCE